MPTAAASPALAGRGERARAERAAAVKRASRREKAPIAAAAAAAEASGSVAAEEDEGEEVEVEVEGEEEVLADSAALAVDDDLVLANLCCCCCCCLTPHFLGVAETRLLKVCDIAIERSTKCLDGRENEGTEERRAICGRKSEVFLAIDLDSPHNSSLSFSLETHF